LTQLARPNAAGLVGGPCCWALGPLHLASCSADLPLLLVIEGKPERVPEGHQGSLHGIRLGLLDGGFMGLAQIHVDAVTDRGGRRAPRAARGRSQRAGPGRLELLGLGSLLIPGP